MIDESTILILRAHPGTVPYNIFDIVRTSGYYIVETAKNKQKNIASLRSLI